MTGSLIFKAWIFFFFNITKIFPKTREIREKARDDNSALAQCSFQSECVFQPSVHLPGFLLMNSLSLTLLLQVNNAKMVLCL